MPIDRRLIAVAMLTADDAWLDAYHGGCAR
ncbi:MAG: hypothetical protein R3D02_03750 [Hyphomicrobiales bacterium]